MPAPDASFFSDPSFASAWAARLRGELAGNVLPWWQRAIFDDAGRLLGGRGNDGSVRDVPRSAVLATRLLWTFASAQARLSRDAAGAQAMQRAWDWLTGPQSDEVHGGVFWSVDAAGRPVGEHKQTYAQAFAIYAFTACHAAQGVSPGETTPALRKALQLFDLLQTHAFDPLDGGCWEGCSRDWRVLEDTRLSDKEPLAPKSMNTMLHVLEALTELLRHHRSHRVACRLRELLELFLDALWLPAQRCFGLFFSPDWQCLTDQVSYGHDIETAWLLVRAAEVLGDDRLVLRARALSLRAADAVLERGLAADGSVLGEGRFDGRVTDDRRHWWCQAEAMVGFWDAWQHGGDPRHAEAAWKAWQFIERHHVDPVGGDWFKTLDAEGRVIDAIPKAGPWECPYHHVRAGLEMTERLQTR